MNSVIRAPKSSEDFSARGLERLLKTQTLGRSSVEFHATLDSTSTRAKVLASSGIPAGALVVTDEQTAGRGRRGRIWHSPSGVNLYFSVVLRPDLPATQLPLVPLAAGLGLATALKPLIKQPVSLKWPNDVLLDNRKVAGLLAEIQPRADGRNPWVVLGIGINVNLEQDQIPEELKLKAGSLLTITGQRQDRTVLLAEVLGGLENELAGLARKGPEFCLPRYRQICRTIGAWVVAGSGGNTIKGQAMAVDDTGRLVIRETGTDRLVSLESGEVTLETMYLGDARTCANEKPTHGS